MRKGVRVIITSYRKPQFMRTRSLGLTLSSVPPTSRPNSRIQHRNVEECRKAFGSTLGVMVAEFVIAPESLINRVRQHVNGKRNAESLADVVALFKRRVRGIQQ